MGTISACQSPRSSVCSSPKRLQTTEIERCRSICMTATGLMIPEGDTNHHHSGRGSEPDDRHVPMTVGGRSAAQAAAQAGYGLVQTGIQYIATGRLRAYNPFGRQCCFTLRRPTLRTCSRRSS
jgi:hypothetical protein